MVNNFGVAGVMNLSQAAGRSKALMPGVSKRTMNAPETHYRMLPRKQFVGAVKGIVAAEVAAGNCIRLSRNYVKAGL